MAGKIWSEKEDKILKELYSDTSTSNIARLLPGRTILSIYQRARALGVLKSPDFMKSEASCRIKNGVTPNQKRNQFPKGNKPWNKGISFQKDLPSESKEAIQKGYFKKGDRPVTAHDPGTIFIIKDSKGTAYKWISMKGGRAKLYHVYLWEMANGPVPTGSIVRFIDGNRENFNLDNLQCITRSENMKLNSYHRFGKEIAGLIQLRGALTRKINKISKTKK